MYNKFRALAAVAFIVAQCMSTMASANEHATANTAPARRIGWWWDAPATADDPEVDALIKWVTAHTDITTSILMRCGPSTLSGKIAGALSPACARAIPELAKLGVESELWLGETDSRSAALQLCLLVCYYAGAASGKNREYSEGLQSDFAVLLLPSFRNLFLAEPATSSLTAAKSWAAICATIWVPIALSSRSIPCFCL